MVGIDRNVGVCNQTQWPGQRLADLRELLEPSGRRSVVVQWAALIGAVPAFCGQHHRHLPQVTGGGIGGGSASRGRDSAGMGHALLVRQLSRLLAFSAGYQHG